MTGARSEHSCYICRRTAPVCKWYPDGTACCDRCYMRAYKKTYSPPQYKCVQCHRQAPAAVITQEGPVCRRCYKQPEQKCSICGKVAPVNYLDKGEPICKKCYVPPKEICCICGRDRTVNTRIDGQPYCLACDGMRRRRSDDKVRLKDNLRRRLNKAFELYSKNGKCQPSKKYGIDWQAIVKFLGPRPEGMQVDHILPLCAFDFDDPLQVRAAFAPENHQWLSEYANKSKKGFYDEKVLRQYIAGFKEG